jgi:hypothetical protein
MNIREPFIIGGPFKEMVSQSFGFINEEISKTRFIKSVFKNGNLWRDVVKPKATQTLSKINASAITKIAKTKIGKGGIALAAGMVAWNLIQHGVKSATLPSPAIPRNYDRGYDILNQNLTDFGSPVNLAKTAKKTITPYYSAVRRGAYTTTRAVRNSNVALSMSDNAIRHHHYN